LPTTNVYIDGFNLYYCGVKDTPYKWLNLLLLSQNLFPGKVIKRIRYFTAKVIDLPNDPLAHERQEIYWRALKTIPNIEIIHGHFVSRVKPFPQYPPVIIPGTIPPQLKRVHILKREEKGSDVNLAAYLIYDNCLRDADESIVISNDSDLAHAIELVTNAKHLGRSVTVVNPNRTSLVRKYPDNHKMQSELRRVATQPVNSINESVLANSQFASPLADARGSFTKPSSW